MRRSVVPLLTALFVLTLPPVRFPSAEDPPSESAAARQRLEEVLANDPALAPETKRALVEALEALDEGGDGARHDASPPSPAEPSVWERLAARLRVYGDLRLRHESSFELDSQRDRHRERIRLRLGAAYAITDELTAGARLTTGQREDPNSPHTTLGTGFERFEVSIDRAYLAYEPALVEGLAFTGGKFAHPFIVNPLYGELERDQDVQPEGILGEYLWKGDGAVRALELRAGEYVLIEQGAAREALSTVGQVGVRLAPAEGWTGLAALGYSYYTDATPDGDQDLIEDSQGNALLDKDGDGEADEFASDFGILHPVLALSYSGWCLPVTLAGEYFWNTEAGNSRDQGWAVGAGVGKAREQGDWQLYYQWQVIQQDAVFSPVAQDDFLLAVNHDSHLVSLDYQALDDVGVRIWALVSQRLKTSDESTMDSRGDQWRVRLDINVKF